MILTRIREAWRENRGTVGVLAFGALAAALMLLLVASGLNRPEPPSYPPTPLQLRPAAGRLVGPELVTIDASAENAWRFFSFEQGTVLERPGPLDWDLAFQRFQVIANGGPGFAGNGGILDLGEVAFDAVAALPETGYVANQVASDTVNAAIEDWYAYSYLSHLLTPKPRVYAVRTAAGRYAKLQLLGYYCPQAMPGCVTFRYVYQGGGGAELREAPASGTGRDRLGLEGGHALAVGPARRGAPALPAGDGGGAGEELDRP